MRPQTLIAAVAFCAALAAANPAAAADIFFKGRFGDVTVGVNTGGHDRHHIRRRHDRPHAHRQSGPRQSFFGGVANDFARDQHRRAEEESFYHDHGKRYRRYRRQTFLDEAWYLGPGASSAPAAEAPVAAAPAPAPAPEVIEVDPPDARGPTFETARTYAPRTVGGPAYRIGSALPAGRPHVALDWRDYNLPRPPAGQTYARFDGAVLLIDSGSRVVRQVLWPTGG